MTLPAGRNIGNFIFSLDGTQLFYIDSGDLRCHDVGSGKGWCDGSALGPPNGLASIDQGPNQLTWIDAANLLVSNYRSEIYRYTLPP